MNENIPRLVCTSHASAVCVRSRPWPRYLLSCAQQRFPAAYLEGPLRTSQIDRKASICQQQASVNVPGKRKHFIYASIMKKKKVDSDVIPSSRVVTRHFPENFATEAIRNWLVKLSYSLNNSSRPYSVGRIV